MRVTQAWKIVLTSALSIGLLVGCEPAEESGSEPSQASEVEDLEGESEEVARTSGDEPETEVNENETEEEIVVDDPIPSWEEEEEEEDYILPEPEEPQDAILCPEGNCYSSLDDVVLTHYALKGLEPIEEESTRLCRRLAVDLWGRIPTWLEV